MARKYDLAARNQAYLEADSVDRSTFAEMRTHTLLVAGDHYSKRESNYYRRLRDDAAVADQQRLRITRNHTRRIAGRYENAIITALSSMGFAPRNENELQDQKAAELYRSIWDWANERYAIDSCVDEKVASFVRTAEVHSKIFWDDQAGDIVGYEPRLDPETGEPVINPETGVPLDDESKPIFKGDFVWQRLQGYNLLRDPSAKSFRTSPYICYRYMMKVEDLKAKFPDLADKIAPTQDDTFIVFDSIRGGYRESEKNEVMVKEWYFRKCAAYPKGQYYFDTDQVELAKGDLPAGIFPIVSETFDTIDDNPRGVGVLRTTRPYQVEVNRTGSKIAEHQTTLGDDKIVTTLGAEITQGQILPGVRGIRVNGDKVHIMEGRNGAQYQPYNDSITKEMYEVSDADEQDDENATNIDPYALLFRSEVKKRKHQKYIRKFERFRIEEVKTFMALAKVFLPDDTVIRAVGRPEMVNISEFKNSRDMIEEVKIKGESEDMASKLGKQLAINHILQYSGNKLTREDIGKLIRLMPYANIEEGASDLTLDYDSAKNVILALDRGEAAMFSPFDNDVYMVKRLSARMRKADFQFLPPEVKAKYEHTLRIHQAAEVQKQAQIQRAQAGFIPQTGYLVSMDLYASDPSDPAKTKRVRLPADAVTWLIKKLEDQGAGLDELENMNRGAVAQMSQMLLSGQGAQVTPMARYRPTAQGLGSVKPTPIAAPPPPSAETQAEGQRS